MTFREWVERKGYFTEDSGVGFPSKEICEMFLDEYEEELGEYELEIVEDTNPSDPGWVIREVRKEG